VARDHDRIGSFRTDRIQGRAAGERDERKPGEEPLQPRLLCGFLDVVRCQAHAERLGHADIKRKLALQRARSG